LHRTFLTAFFGASVCTNKISLDMTSTSSFWNGIREVLCHRTSSQCIIKPADRDFRFRSPCHSTSTFPFSKHHCGVHIFCFLVHLDRRLSGSGHPHVTVQFGWKSLGGSDSSGGGEPTPMPAPSHPDSQQQESDHYRPVSTRCVYVQCCSVSLSSAVSSY
jgi:hypothetical protein